MPTKINDPLTLLAWTQQDDGVLVFEAKSAPPFYPAMAIGSTSVYHARCISAYTDIAQAHYILGHYGATAYEEGEPLPPAFVRCSRCEGKFARSPKRQR